MQRLSASRKAFRMAGIDIGVHRSDCRARVDKLNRQGSRHLRWALYEAALSACRPSSPDHADYLAHESVRNERSTGVDLVSITPGRQSEDPA